MKNNAVLSCDKLVIGYNGKPILPPITLGIREGDFWAVIGRNGSGKTTWFRTLLDLIPPVAGKVWTRPHIRMAYVPQRSDYDLNFPATAWDVVAMGTERGLSFFGPSLPSRARNQTRKAFEAAEAMELMDMSFRDLSEGQKQRVMLARVVASLPQLALLDEPTAAMDVRAEEETLALIDRLRKEYHMAIVIVSHFLGVAARFAEKVLLMDNERKLVRVGSPAEVLTHVDFATSAALASEGITANAPAEASAEPKESAS